MTTPTISETLPIVRPADTNVRQSVPAPPPAPTETTPDIALENTLGRIVGISEAEQVKLLTCEAVLEMASHTFVEAGLALAEIRDGELYRAESNSFEAYCREKWQYGKHYVNQVIAAAQVVKRLGANCSLAKPLHEGQVRPLVGLDPEQAEAAWRRATEKAGGRKITARLVRGAVLEIVPPPPKPATPPPPTKGEQRRLLVEGLKELLILIFQKAPHETLLAKAEELHRKLDILFPK